MDDVFVATEAGVVPLPPLLPEGIEVEEGTNMWTCAAFDPGGTTGWAILQIHEEALVSDEYKILDNIAGWSCGQFNGSIGHQTDKVLETADSWPDANIVSELFILRSSVMSPELLDPVRLNHTLEWWLARGGQRAWDAEDDGPDAWKPRKLYYQQPSLAMSTATDDRLKLVGAYNATVGLPHARDAVRHALTFARRWKARQIDMAIPTPRKANPHDHSTEVPPARSQ